MASGNEIRLPPKWIELNLTKRECATFVPSSEDVTLCQCGRKKSEHGDFTTMKHVHQDTWIPSLHTRQFPTDAYGTLIFEGEHHPNKAHFVRLSYDSNPELVIQLMTLVWGHTMPKLLITIQGGSTNFELTPRLGKILQTGLVKAAKSCNAWVFTGGFNDGVTKHVGVALSLERSLGGMRHGGGRIVTVGIAPWGVVEHREDLLFKNKDRIYSPLEHAQSKFRLLNPRHSNFLLVDNGSVGKMGGETYFRRRLEKCISRYPTTINRGCDIPVVCVVIEGGFYTLRTIGDYLHDEPPTPVVIFGGSGRTADLLAWIFKKVQQLPPDASVGSLREEVYMQMMKIYHVNAMQCVILFAEVKRILVKRHLVTVYGLHAADEDFDATILASLFRSQHWSPLQQLSLALVWDRVDIAVSEVFVYGREWSTDNLEHAMMEALVYNRVEFVSLLLEHGLNMQTFLTLSRLEKLYNTEHSKLLRLLIADIAKLRSEKSHDKEKVKAARLTINHVGIAISHMMGYIYKSNYINMVSTSSNISSSSLGISFFEEESRELSFAHPFDDLFVWAVLTRRHQMALLFWRHGQGALAKALVAVKLNKSIADQLSMTERSQTSVALEFLTCSNEWERLSLTLVDLCFKQDQKLARQILTMELERWSKMNCLTLAVMANHRMLLGHPCSQMLLADLWMGALSIKKHATFKVILGVFCPLVIFYLDFKSTEELKLLPHQEKHIMDSTASEQIDLEWRDAQSDAASLRTYRSKSRNSLGNIFNKNRIFRAFRKVQKSRDGVQGASLHHVEQHFAEHRSDGPTNVNGLPFTARDISILKPHHHVPLEADNSLSSTGKSLHPSHWHHYRQREGSSFITTKQRLPMWTKFYEFQKAPVTNFYRHTMAYLVFVFILAYMILVPQDPNTIGFSEIYVISYLVTLGFEVCRDFISIDALNWTQKVVEFKTHVWQIADFCVIIFCMVGVALRFSYDFEYGMLMYRISSIYWNLRLYKYMGVHRFLGPKIMMMSRMLVHMAYFAMIILVVIIAFGLAREAIRFPDIYPTWRNIAEAFLEPYVMMFGEVDTDALAPQCGDPNQPSCPVGYWVIPITWAVYMLVANILIVNVLIAVFNGIYSEIDAISLEVWMFQRFTFVMEFEQKPLLPPPAIILCHIFAILKWIYQKTKLCLCEQELETQLEDDEGPKIIMGNDHRLKTFLSPAEANMVFDFEEDNLLFVNPARTSGFSGGIEEMIASVNPDITTGGGVDVFKDRQGIQQLRVNFQEICGELENHRTKLDKLIAFWEMEQEHREAEHVDHEDDSNDIAENSQQLQQDALGTVASIWGPNHRDRDSDHDRGGIKK